MRTSSSVALILRVASLEERRDAQNDETTGIHFPQHLPRFIIIPPFPKISLRLLILFLRTFWVVTAKVHLRRPSDDRADGDCGDAGCSHSTGSSTHNPPRRMRILRMKFSLPFRRRHDARRGSHKHSQSPGPQLPQFQRARIDFHAMEEPEFDARCDYEIECITSGRSHKAVSKLGKNTMPMDSGQHYVL